MLDSHLGYIFDPLSLLTRILVPSPLSKRRDELLAMHRSHACDFIFIETRR
uniref:Uncharacterized protein n=1 Tax=Rhizophora mucronata TaxID=61149 RepID=A0A2P2JUQ8_RHIMU